MKTFTLFRRSLRLITVIGILPLHFSALSAGPAVLHIDGVLRTPGNSYEGARVSVLRDARPVAYLTEGLARFSMGLDLQHTYLLSFEREGCITKQLFFDTRVPATELAKAPFTFPFKVTLEDRSPGSTARYAGPVGFVRYDASIGDFDYDKNYNMLQDLLIDNNISATMPVELERPLRSTRKMRLERGTEDISELEAITPNTIISATTTGPSMISLIHLEPLPVERTNIHMRKMVEPFIDATLSQDEATSGVMLSSLHEEVATTLASTTTSIQRKHVNMSIRRPQVSCFPSAPALQDGRTEELVVERLRVTTIIRITENGHTTEFRRIAHRYGQVYCFTNGIPCSEQAFDDVRAQK